MFNERSKLFLYIGMFIVWFMNTTMIWYAAILSNSDIPSETRYAIAQGVSLALLWIYAHITQYFAE